MDKIAEERLTNARRDAASIVHVVLFPAVKEFVSRMELADHDMTMILSLLAHYLAVYQVETLVAMAGNKKDRSLMLLDMQYEGMRTYAVKVSDQSVPFERTAND